MLLALDVGNTNIVIGFLDESGIRNIARLETDRDKTAHEYAISLRQVIEFSGIAPENIDGAILSSVVPPINGALIAAVRMITGIRPLVVGPGMKTGLNIALDNPATMGSEKKNSKGSGLPWVRSLTIPIFPPFELHCVFRHAGQETVEQDPLLLSEALIADLVPPVQNLLNTAGHSSAFLCQSHHFFSPAPVADLPGHQFVFLQPGHSPGHHALVYIETPGDVLLAGLAFQ